MSRGYRSIILALGLILGGAQQPTEQSNAQGHANNGHAGPKPVASQYQTVEPTYRPYAERYSDSCYNAQNHDTADLCAQWRPAIAAEKAAAEARLATIAAIIGTVLSLATVIGLIVTICQTHGALGEARRGNRLNLLFERRARRESRKYAADQERALEIACKNALAAERQVFLSENASRQQLRAYVVISGVKANGFGPGHYPLFRVELKNTGQTPAINARLETEFHLLDKGSIPSRQCPTIEHYSSQTIGAGELLISDPSLGAPISETEWDALLLEDLNAWVTIYAAYQDIFGEPHTVGIHGRVTGLPGEAIVKPVRGTDFFT